MIYAVGWLVAIAVFAIAEAATVALVSIWFAAGGVAGLITSLFTETLWVQLLVFFVVSGLLLAATRPLCKKFLSGRSQRTNADMVIGKEGTITQAVDNLAPSGRVFVCGQSWAARSEGGETIPQGAVVQVCRIEGVRLFVRPADEKPQ